MKQEQTYNPWPIPPWAIVSAIIPLLVILSAYLYNVAYVFVYDVPVEFIEFSISDYFNGSLNLLISVTICLFIDSIRRNYFYPRMSLQNFDRTKAWLNSITFFIIGLFYFGLKNHTLIISLFFDCLIFLILNEVLNYINWFGAKPGEDRGKIDQNSIWNIFNTYEATSSTLPSVIIMLCILSMIKGYAGALTKEFHDVLYVESLKKEYVILKHYKNKLITVPLNTETNKSQQTLRIFFDSNGKDWVINKKHLGPLK